MIREFANASDARNWRDIPQPLKPRSMSRGGRLRLAFAILRGAAVAALAGAIAWGGWQVLGILRQDSRAMPAAAKTVPLKAPELITSSGGVLDSAWLARTLVLPRNISLMEVNVDRVSAQVLTDHQVLTAKASKKFPDRLVVEITERMPVARVMAEWRGQQQPLLVASDGVVFPGVGYSPDMVSALPWLAGVDLVRRNDTFQPIEGMDIVNELLVKAQLEAAHLFRSWQIVSLSRLDTDRKLDVTTAEGFKITFSIGDSRMSDLARRMAFVDQLGRLDVIWERVSHLPVATGSIDLSLGSNVPVRLEPTVAETPATGAAASRPSANARPAPLFPSSRL